uniref:Integrase catalytic domain-containing protein n=1 Tax=Trichuris muris TaxID=70415 RepID=A0A5S6Q1M4_TRIMR
MPTATPSGRRYMLTFIDDYSRFTFIRLLKTKDETVCVVKEYVAVMNTRFGRHPATFRTDNGREYVNQELQEFFKRKGIEHQFSAPYTPQQNGVAERKNRTLVEMAKSMLVDAKLPERFWGEAICTAAYLQNRLPNRSAEKTPFELWTGKRPDLSHIRTFGSKAYSFVPQQKRRKWDDRAMQGILVGYDNATKGYRLLYPVTNRIWISRSVRIIEKDEQYVECTVQEAYMPEGARELELKKQIGKSIEPSIRGAEVNVENIFESPKQELPSQEEIEVSSNESLLSPALRRSQRLNKGIPPQKLSYKVHTAEACEPSSWEEVTCLPPCERDKWMAAAKEEMASLKNREVWELVELPAGRKVISSKWVFKIKRKADGAIDTYKARLVARGFSQRYGEDYDEIFAPVVKHETIRMLLSIAAMRSLHVRHFDVKCAYLNGEIHEELYMEQPPGFVQPGNENLVLRLKRIIVFTV